MLEIKDISLHFDFSVLQNVSFQVKKGETIGIVGESGGGKSSMLKIIAGLLDATSGKITLNKREIFGPKDRLIPGNPDIQLVNQDYHLDTFHTVRENVTQKLLHLEKSLKESFATELLTLVQLEKLENQKANTLSGGEQQRLAIIRALAQEPKVLLLDEPFAHLDVHLKQTIGNYLQALCKLRKMICILVSHEGEDVIEWCNKIHFFEKGKIGRTASPESFYWEPTSFYEGRFFGEINEVSILRKKVLFRPSEFEIVSENGIPLIFKSARFSGSFWRNVFQTSKREMVILYTKEAINENIQISLKR